MRMERALRKCIQLEDILYTSDLRPFSSSCKFKFKVEKMSKKCLTAFLLDKDRVFNAKINKDFLRVLPSPAGQ